MQFHREDPMGIPLVLTESEAHVKTCQFYLLAMVI